MFVPLIASGIVTGFISLQNVDRENAFNESDVRLLETLANSMSVALENARLFDETQRLLKETDQRAAELAIINSVQAGLASKLDAQGIYDLVGDKTTLLHHGIGLETDFGTSLDGGAQHRARRKLNQFMLGRQAFCLRAFAGPRRPQQDQVHFRPRGLVDAPRNLDFLISPSY